MTLLILGLHLLRVSCVGCVAVQVSLEMETFHLLDLARCSEGNSLQAAAFCIAAAERYSNKCVAWVVCCCWLLVCRVGPPRMGCFLGSQQIMCPWQGLPSASLLSCRLWVCTVWAVDGRLR